jgi:hypothetical protein
MRPRTATTIEAITKTAMLVHRHAEAELRPWSSSAFTTIQPSVSPSTVPINAPSRAVIAASQRMLAAHLRPGHPDRPHQSELTASLVHGEQEGDHDAEHGDEHRHAAAGRR